MIKKLGFVNGMTLQEVTDCIIEVHKELFKNITLESQIKKFEEEYKEMIMAGESDEYDVNDFLEEVADLFIVACGIMRFSEPTGRILIKGIMDGYLSKENQENGIAFIVTNKIIEKMNKNIDRVWSKTNEGNYKHVSSYN